jgi:hypothetical protein
MKPLQVYLDASDMRRLELVARQHGWTKSQAIRVAVRALSGRTADPLLGLSGMVRGLPSDASERVDAYLAETFDAKRRRRRSPR